MNYDSNHCFKNYYKILLTNVNKIEYQSIMDLEVKNHFVLTKKKACKNCWLKSCFSQLKDSNINSSTVLINNIVRLKKGEGLIKSGDAISGLYCIRDGTVKIYKTGNNNKEYIFWRAGKGEIVGLNSFLNCEIFSFSATALSNVSACYISALSMHKLINEQPFVIDGLMQNLCSKMNFMESRITNISTRRKKEQIVDFLFLLTKQNTDKIHCSVSVNYSVADIGNLMGLSRSYVNKVLRDLEKMAILKINRNEILIHDITALGVVCEFSKKIHI